jgi:CBS domain containing-hemolysin-like protein
VHAPPQVPQHPLITIPTAATIASLWNFKLIDSNVIVNETLPIVFDSVLGGGWPAVVLSTALIVIFGEIIPQAACINYGLSIGARFSGYPQNPIKTPINSSADLY